MLVRLSRVWIMVLVMQRRHVWVHVLFGGKVWYNGCGVCVWGGGVTGPPERVVHVPQCHTTPR